ncbi:MAG: hypothetical protein ACRC10_09665 [Thermoguttaceae bacterium]
MNDDLAMNSFQQQSRSGLTLLEIILSIIILGGAIAVLGGVGRLGLQSAALARDITQAELLCESVVGQIRVGLIPLETTLETTFDSDYPDSQVNSQSGILEEPRWFYSIEVGGTDEEGLVSVLVTVQRNQPDEPRPVICRMMFWMIDPAFLEEMELEMQEILNPEAAQEAANAG